MDDPLARMNRRARNTATQAVMSCGSGRDMGGGLGCDAPNFDKCVCGKSHI
jgi:hypothetical protein